MNRERAEAFLRVLAETELRDALARQPGRAPRGDRREEVADLLRQPAAAARLSMLTGRQRQALTLQFSAGLSEAQTAVRMRISPGAVKSHTTRAMSRLRTGPEDAYLRTRRVARVLTALGALDEEVADQVLADGTLALDLRRIGTGGERTIGLIRMGLPLRFPARTPAAGPPPGSAAPRRIVPLGQLITVPDVLEITTELYLLSYAETALGPQLSVFARTRVPPHRWAPTGSHFFERFAVTDDRGTSYRVSLRALGGAPAGRTLMLRPGPAHRPRWLDLTTAPDRPAVRIDLAGTRPPGAAEVTVTQSALGPGTYLLHTIAARLLAAAWPVSPDLPPVNVLADGPPARLAEGLGDIIAALQACGALSMLSPVPGQLAALCASLDIQGHGITARPARDLPEPWLSLLARYQRRKLRLTPAQDGCAAVTAVLPEQDGIGLAVLGLHNSHDRTVVHLHASGPRSAEIYRPDSLHDWAALWVRDAEGYWHATRTVGRSRMDDGVALRVEVVPPLSRATAWIELVAAGPSDEVRAALPLPWQ